MGTKASGRLQCLLNMHRTVRRNVSGTRDHGYEPYYVRAVHAVQWPHLIVMFLDNTVRNVNISGVLDNKQDAYEFLLDPEVFATVQVSFSKVCLTWNHVLDISGYALYHEFPSEQTTWPGTYPQIRLTQDEYFRRYKIWTGQWPGDDWPLAGL